MLAQFQQSQPVLKGWRAELELLITQRDGRSVLSRRRHIGPLGVQRPFYPESDGTCHLYVLHPPGGLVGGDQLSLRVEVALGARALLTTPAATKFYRSFGNPAGQNQRFSVARGARLEWLPQESIAYDGADITTQTKVDLVGDAEFVGWDILCLGRPARAEAFVHGAITQRTEIFRDGVPLMFERARYVGGSSALAQPFGLRGQPVVGSLVCVTNSDTGGLMPELRDVLRATAGDDAECSQLAGALVCRFVGSKVERAQQAFRAAWSVLRQRCWGAAASAPRIWLT